MRLPSTDGRGGALCAARRPASTAQVGSRRAVERRRSPARRRGVPTSSTTSGTAPSANSRINSLIRGKRVIAQPLDDITIRGQQLELAVALDGLQRPDPRVELLRRELALEHAQTAVP